MKIFVLYEQNKGWNKIEANYFVFEHVHNLKYVIKFKWYHSEDQG